MRWIDYYILNEAYSVLDAAIYDEEDICEIKNRYANARYVKTELSSMQYLHYFERVEILILTGGTATRTDWDGLYACEFLKMLVLEYEETDSDEEGIDLSQFPMLSYVYTRSDLNIRNISQYENTTLRMDIQNYYRRGKTIKSSDVSLKVPKAVFFSTEAQAPASVPLMKILNRFESKMEKVRYSDNLDSIGIIPVCMSERMLSQGFGKERNYVSMKKRSADIRLRIDYEAFLATDDRGRVQLCKACVARAAAYLKRKDPSFQYEKFMVDLQSVP